MVTIPAWPDAEESAKLILTRTQKGAVVHLEITPRGYEPSKRVRDTLEERCDKFGKFASDLKLVRFTLVGERLEFVCQVNLHAHGKDFHAEATSGDMLASVDKACSSMERQLRKYKERRFDHRTRKDSAGPTTAAILESSLNADSQESETDESE